MPWKHLLGTPNPGSSRREQDSTSHVVSAVGIREPRFSPRGLWCGQSCSGASEHQQCACIHLQGSLRSPSNEERSHPHTQHHTRVGVVHQERNALQQGPAQEPPRELQVTVMEKVGDDWEGDVGSGSDPELCMHTDIKGEGARAPLTPTTWSLGSSWRHLD